MTQSTALLSFLSFMIWGCGTHSLEEKGFAVEPESNGVSTEREGIARDSLRFATQPSNVLLTGISHIRLATIYKVNYRRDDSTVFIGSNSYHYRYEEGGDATNNWNQHIMPGFEAVYGYNLVNVSHFDLRNGEQKHLFERPVLIKTLYYPAFSKDTLNNQPVLRQHVLVTVYDEDTDKDGRISTRDLRRLHGFGLEGERHGLLVPKNYSVIKSEYDPANDRMLVFSRLDENGNGRQDDTEPIHIHWIDLTDPTNSGRQY